MKIQKVIIVFVLGVVSMSSTAQVGMNRPYVDEKLFHFGFQLGVNFASFGITDSEASIQMLAGQTDTLHARVSSVMPGFHVGFVTDLRLCKFLNLRFCPGMQFSSRTISYKASNENHPVHTQENPGFGSSIDIMYMPVYLPLYLKFSAEREGNYRPYVIAGGGVSFNVSRDKNKPVLMNVMDYFCEVGFGVDLYFQWFKWCPELTYRIGFANQLCPADQHPNLIAENSFYTNAISRMTNHCICLTFNFE
ncbi:MAG: outer membrane beta-barrel protein [Paludibacteraceae bacterium]|nr:outer membrane beta-barrel protein [Paludibacteraceae bacterium]